MSNDKLALQTMLHTARRLQALLSVETLSAAKDTAGALSAMLRQALSEHEAEKQAGPVAGWKLVPELPTQDMEHAGIAMLPNAPDVAHWWIGYPKATYRAMLAAAPSAPPSESAQAEQAGPVAGQASASEEHATPAGWADAYAAFQGAFDTPLARRRMDDEFCRDARRRLGEFNDAMLAAHQPYAAPSAPPSESDKEDAELFRWLESQAHWQDERDMAPGGRWWFTVLVDKGRPSFRDAARAARAKKGPQ